MFLGLTIQQLTFFIILIVSFVLLLTEKLRNDVVGVMIILALAVTGVLSAKDALSGFGSEPAIVVASIFVISGAFQRTGLADILGGWVSKLAGKNYTQAVIVIMISVEVLSAFTHHVTTTAVMLPIVLSMCRERDIPASKLLMPLSISASLGTTITIIGAPAFLVASDLLQRAGRPGLSIFSISPIGIALSIAGTLFMVFIGRYLLPVRKQEESLSNLYRLDQYLTEIKILPDSPFLGKTLREIKEANHYQFIVTGWVRNGEKISSNFGRLKFREDDVILLHATPEDIISFRGQKGVDLHPVEKFLPEEKTDTTAEEAADELVQAVISPSSELIGRTLREVDFRSIYGAIVVGLWRREGLIRQELSKVRIRPGDVLLLQGEQEAIQKIAKDTAFLMLIPFHSELKLRRKAKIAGIIMIVTILLASSNLLSLEIVMLLGAITMILVGCISVRQAYRSIDTQVFVFIAGAIPLGAAIQKTGTDKLMAGWLESAVGSLNPIIIMLVIFLIVSIITQFMSDAGTTAFFAPVVIALANLKGMAPEPFVITVAMAAVAAFLTPIGHHGNLLIYGPGGYRFKDFLIIGIPLTILIGLIVVFLSRILWPH